MGFDSLLKSYKPKEEDNSLPQAVATDNTVSSNYNVQGPTPPGALERLAMGFLSGQTNPQIGIQSGPRNVNVNGMQIRDVSQPDALNQGVVPALNQLAQNYLGQKQMQSKMDYQKSVHTIMGSDADANTKMTQLMDLTTQHGSDYGLGVDKIEAAFAKMAGDGYKPKTQQEAIAFEQAKNADQGWKPQSKQDVLDIEKSKNEIKLSEKQDQFDTKRWDKIVNDTDPTKASTRTVLGAATKANYQANRALATLQNPMVTKQEAGNIMADIAGIYQGGAPTNFGMSEQQYHSVQSSLAEARQYLTGNPQEALPPQIKSRLMETLFTMKKTNDDVLRHHLDYIEKAQPHLVGKHSDEWYNIKNMVLSHEYSGGISEPAPGAQQVGQQPASPQANQQTDPLGIR